MCQVNKNLATKPPPLLEEELGNVILLFWRNFGTACLSDPEKIICKINL